MPFHFGVNLRKSKYGLKISRDKYAIINNKSSFIRDEIYSDEFCKEHMEQCLINYDLNMKYFSKLDKNEFESSLNEFIKNEHFIEVFDLNKYNNVPGYYILVLDEFCQAYIGTTCNIKQRVRQHWHTRKEFDRLIFGGVYNSIISIDSFRALDTTRIFVLETNNTFIYENKYIDSLPSKFMLNRTCGGILKDGMMEAIKGRRIRELK